MIENNVSPGGWAPKLQDKVTLRAANGARLGAEYRGATFAVAGYAFDAPACREAAQFFTLLAEILES